MAQAKPSTKPVPIEKSMAMRYAYQVGGFRGAKLLKMFKGYSKSVIYKHCKKPLNGQLKADNRIGSGIGRPSKLNRLDHRNINKAMSSLRESDGSFTSKRMQVVTGLQRVSNRTVRRGMNSSGYKYLPTRRKGVLTKDDVIKRLAYCKDKVKNNVKQDYWSYGISLYLDGTGFVYKTNPMDQACAPRAREWRRPDEGLNYKCTAKGKKEGTTQAKFMVAISYDRGVVMCEQYTNITGPKFAKMMDNCLPQAFALSVNPHDKRILQDGDPSQNSAVAKEVIADLGGEVVPIPARSPDMNPIENLFSLTDRALIKDTKARNITSESFDEFSSRVRDIMVNFDIQVINKLIGSMENRINEVIRRKGQRTKY